MKLRRQLIVKFIFLEVEASGTLCCLLNEFIALLEHLIGETFILAQSTHLIHEYFNVSDSIQDNLTRRIKLLVAKYLVCHG